MKLRKDIIKRRPSMAKYRLNSMFVNNATSQQFIQKTKTVDT